MSDGAWLLRLYPRRWRDRYEPELLDLFMERPPDRRDAIDLVRGALDAHLHPPVPSRAPVFAAITAGAGWFVVGLGAATDLTPPDWPGYLTTTLLPATLAAVAGCAAIVAAVLRLGDGPGPLARVAAVLAVLGSMSLVLALGVALVGGPYGAVTGAAGTLAGVGTAVLGLALLRSGRRPDGDLMTVIGAVSLLPPPAGFVLAGIAWTALGIRWALVRAGSDVRGAAV